MWHWAIVVRYQITTVIFSRLDQVLESTYVADSCHSLIPEYSHFLQMQNDGCSSELLNLEEFMKIIQNRDSVSVIREFEFDEVDQLFIVESMLSCLCNPMNKFSVVKSSLVISI